METVTTSDIELQKIVQKLEKLEKMINPNSKKSLILWEEDESFKALISSITEYGNTCDTSVEFPIELLDKLKALKEDVTNQIAESAEKITELNKQGRENTELSEKLSTIYISAMAGNSIDEYAEALGNETLSPMKEYIDTINTAIPESDEYIKAEKIIKSKIANLENSVHITIDLERTTSKASALAYIKTEITPAVERLQSEYDAKYVATDITEDSIMALAIRRTFTEKVYDTIFRPIANLFRRKTKVK